MSVDDEAGPPASETDEPGWEVEADDDWGAAVIATVGRQLKLRREAAGLRAAEFGTRIGYGEDLVYKVEAGKRIPRQEYLDRSDVVLDAGGLISASWEDVKRVRYPKRVRELGKLEERAVEIGLYECNSIHGLLQTEEHARTLFEAAQPPYSSDEVERMTTARIARQAIFERTSAPAIIIVLEEAPLRRPIGGTMMWRRQLERLLEVGRLRNVTLQVLPTDSEAHPGLDGRIELLKFEDGTATGRSDGAFNARPVSDLRQLRVLELRFATIRSQALSRKKSETFIEDLLGEK
ncbi:helix-turn-helix domain-containing protein [Streptomyces seoulensis]|uniref:helix-turn-helix domain-containing protein n=1 Tax=Streptomyces seoulensis TaxID=73044 RepID=UPI003C2E90D1